MRADGRLAECRHCEEGEKRMCVRKSCLCEIRIRIVVRTVIPDLQCFIYIPEDERSTNHTDPSDKLGCKVYTD